jgi:SsrA-binding protein
MQLCINTLAGSAQTRSSTPWQKDGTLRQMTIRGPRSLYKGAALVTERSYIVATNRQAYHDYFVDETIEAGIVLTGTEVKSIREGKVNLRGAFARIKEGEVWLENVHIAEYEHGTYMNHAPLRDRKLLMHRREIARLTQRIQAKGQTLVPLKLYFKENHVKVELGLCRGKKLYDKREAIAERESQRELARITKQRLR